MTIIGLGDVNKGGEWLEFERNRRGLRLKDVAEKTELAVNTVSKLENGLIKKPSASDLVSLGQFFGYTPTEVMHIYGYWEIIEDQMRGPIGELAAILGELPEDPRDKMLDNFLTIVYAAIRAGSGG